MTIQADVVVIGGGNAALCAALSAREAGAQFTSGSGRLQPAESPPKGGHYQIGSGVSVTLFECAPPELRGGNSRHTRNMRCMHTAPTDVLTDSYPEDEYLADLLRVTGGETTPRLAQVVIRESPDATTWMKRHGVRFQPPLSGTLHLGRTNTFFLGGGKALMNAYYAAAEKTGIDVFYNAEVVDLKVREGRFESGIVVIGGEPREFQAKALVVASGGFESNLEWLEQVWGKAARNFIVRGTPYNKGKLLRILLDRGAEPIGDPTQCHAVAVDGRAPKFDGGIVTRLDSVPLGIAVNARAERFDDEGADLWSRRYAIWGRLVAEQPDQIAYSIIDSKVVGRFMPSVFPPIAADSIKELAAALGLPADKLEAVVRGFNQAVVPGRFDHNLLDDCRTEGLTPPKSHWAQRIDCPPFLAYPLRPGITFTYLSVKVNERAELQMTGGGSSPNIFAAGEIMAGNIVGKGYLAGLGMTVGTVFGRIAGQEAAKVTAGAAR